jgi:hypothetical protein
MKENKQETVLIGLPSSLTTRWHKNKILIKSKIKNEKKKKKGQTNVNININQYDHSF